jgi:16S rRNA (guanine966-N2)-methyltransferase
MLETLLAAEKPGQRSSAALEPGTDELWAGLLVADLYAGTGALGIEGLSRGAAWCDFVESDASARRVVERNLTATHLSERARILPIRVEKALTMAKQEAFHAPYGLVLLDPPYALGDAVGDVLERLVGAEWLEPAALVAIEHDEATVLAERITTHEPGSERSPELTLVRRRRHGGTALSIYRYGPPAG